LAEREVIPLTRNIKDLDRQTGTKAPFEGKKLSGASANPFPIIIAEWDRNAREIVRVAPDYYNSRHMINARVWYHEGGGLKAGKAGITLAVKHLPALADALANAESQAREFGLIEGARNERPLHGRVAVL